MNKEYIYFIKAKVKAMAFPLHIARACPVDKANPAWFSDLRTHQLPFTTDRQPRTQRHRSKAATMRLIKTKTHFSKEFIGNEISKYAILSHA
jgi:hypothetical protein